MGQLHLLQRSVTLESAYVQVRDCGLHSMNLSQWMVSWYLCLHNTVALIKIGEFFICPFTLYFHHVEPLHTLRLILLELSNAYLWRGVSTYTSKTELALQVSF